MLDFNINIVELLAMAAFRFSPVMCIACSVDVQLGWGKTQQLSVIRVTTKHGTKGKSENKHSGVFRKHEPDAMCLQPQVTLRQLRMRV